MQSIEITLPSDIEIQDVKKIFEEGLAQITNSKYTCNVEFLEIYEGENLYKISTDRGPGAFYLIGVIAATCATVF